MTRQSRNRGERNSGAFLEMRSVNLSEGSSGPASRGGVCKTGGALSFHRTCSQFVRPSSIGGLSSTQGLSA